MKIFTPDGAELMVVEKIEPTDKGILIAGQIMGAMPMKGELRPAEVRAALKFVSFKLIRRVIGIMLFGK